jgi:hypothetical protein
VWTNTNLLGPINSVGDHLKNEISIYDNKIKMYFSGIAIVILVASSLALGIIALIQLSILDSDILFKVLFYTLLFLLLLTVQLPFRPKQFVTINDESITLFYGKHVKHVKQNFLLADISQVEIVNRFLYEKIKICVLRDCINIRSSEYNKADYEAVKKWAETFQINYEIRNCG